MCVCVCVFLSVCVFVWVWLEGERRLQRLQPGGSRFKRHGPQSSRSWRRLRARGGSPNVLVASGIVLSKYDAACDKRQSFCCMEMARRGDSNMHHKSQLRDSTMQHKLCLVSVPFQGTMLLEIEAFGRLSVYGSCPSPRKLCSLKWCVA